MSDEQLTSGQTSDASGNAEAGDTKKDQVAYDTYRKVLSEKKNRDQQVAALQAELESLKSAELEKQGNTQAALETYKKKLAETESARSEERKKFAWRSVTSEVKAIAKELGCLDGEALLKLADFSTVEVKEDFTVDPNDLKRVAEEARAKYSYLFKKNAPAVNDLPPSSGRPGAPKQPMELSREELANRIRTAQFQK